MPHIEMMCILQLFLQNWRYELHHVRWLYMYCLAVYAIEHDRGEYFFVIVDTQLIVPQKTCSGIWNFDLALYQRWFELCRVWCIRWDGGVIPAGTLSQSSIGSSER